MMIGFDSINDESHGNAVATIGLIFASSWKVF